MNISLVITTYQREHLLAQSLDRLLNLTLPNELIVVDDGGEDGTPDVVADFGARAGIDVQYIYTHQPGPSLCSHARNVGIRRAQHEWIVTSEPELWFETDVLAQLVELHPRHPEDVISSGRIRFAPEGYRPDSGPPPRAWEEAVGWVAPFVALYKRNWLWAIGGWDESFPGPWGWDDTDLLTRLRLSGHGQTIATEITAVHLYHGLGKDSGGANEQHFLAKDFDAGDLIANRGIEWGIPKARG